MNLRGGNHINVILYYPNEKFINSLREIYSKLDLEYKLYATYEIENLEKNLKSESNSTVFLPRTLKLDSKVKRIVYLSEERSEGGLYIYQSGISFLKSISDYIVADTEKTIANILIPSGFNSDFEILMSVIKRLNENGNRSLVIDTNPCRSLCEFNWDYLTKEILNNDINLLDIPYIDEKKIYYIKPFNSFKDYYLNCEIYGSLLESVKNLDSVDYIFFLHYLNDYYALENIERNSNINILLSYGELSDEAINELSINETYINQFLETDSICFSNKRNIKYSSSVNTWESIKSHYREFELSIFEEVSRC